MRAPPSHRRTWAAAGLALAAAAVAAAATLSDEGWAAAPAVVTEAAASTASASGALLSPDLPGEGAGERNAAFRRRLAAFAPLEAGLRRAFFGQPPTFAPRRATAAVRVRPAGTEQGCLSQAVYYEARGEPAEGQAAVAQVVLNRVRSGVHPASVCGVVFEGARHAGCQFSFACDPRLAGRPVGGAAWRRAETVAAAALATPGRPELRGALNYHADYVRPGWAQRLRRAVEIGRHIFYGAPEPSASPATLAE